MKFLVIAKPPRTGTSAMVQAVKETVKRNLESGQIDCLYSFADATRAVAILNADSAEALAEQLVEPGFPPPEAEIHPLIDWNRFVDKVIEVMKRQGL